MRNVCVRVPALALAVATAAGLEQAGAQQCSADWGELFTYQAIPISVAASAEFDDGNGPALFVGGADDDGSRWFYRWDGSSWTAPDAPFNSSPLRDAVPNVTAMATWNDGTTDLLVVGGEFRRVGSTTVEGIAAWDGTTWSPLGAGFEDGNLTSIVGDIEPLDDGTGGTLFASGLFTHSGGAPLDGIARWDGTSWIPLGGGPVLAAGDMQVYDDGGGEDLYIAGASLVARWDGTSWSSIGATDDIVRQLAVYDVGGGPELYAAGLFTTVGGVAASGIARWDGTAWSPVGAGITASSALSLRDFEIFDDGTGPGLYLTGVFGVNGMPPVGLARWDGAWTVPPGNVSASTLLAHDDGSGPSLFAGGGFLEADGMTAPHVARFDGTAWSSVGPVEGMNGSVDALLAFDDGTGEQLYAGGAFTTAGAEPDAAAVARWDGAEWSAVGNGVAGTPGTGVPRVHDFAIYDDGTGPSLYAGGYFTQPSRCMARWDGAAWQPVGIGMNGPNGLAVVEALEVFDDGSGAQLYAAGNFDTAGGAPASWIARWDGSAWSQLGPEVFTGVVSAARIHDLAVHDDGTGPALWAGGSFNGINGAAVSGPSLARWDGSDWFAVTGTIGAVRRLAEFTPPGAGAPLLVAGGDFSQVGGVAANRIATWDGSVWSPLTTGANGSVRGLRAWNDGVAGERLLVSGHFDDAGGVAADGFAIWDGAAWSAAPGGFAFFRGRPFAAFDPDGGGASLYVGDSFGRLAEWRTDCDAPASYCTGKTNSLGCVPFVATVGEPSATATGPFRLVANDMVPTEVGSVFYGFKKSNLNFQGGKLCVKAPIYRTLHKTPKSDGPPPCAGVLRFNFQNRIQNGLDPALTPGQTVFAQWHARDPGDPAGFGSALTDAVRFTIAP